MKLIIVEGVDGSGKSTLIKALKDFFFKRVFIFNYSYPKHSWEMFQEAAEARGQYFASVEIFKEIFRKEPDAVIICDRFHLGEYAYGPVKRGYPEWLAEETFKIEDELITAVGRENIRLIICSVADSGTAVERSMNREGEYLRLKEEYEDVMVRYNLAFVKTKLPCMSILTDVLSPNEVCAQVLKFLSIPQVGDEKT